MGVGDVVRIETLKGENAVVKILNIDIHTTEDKLDTCIDFEYLEEKEELPDSVIQGQGMISLEALKKIEVIRFKGEENGKA